MTCVNGRDHGWLGIVGLGGRAGGEDSPGTQEDLTGEYVFKTVRRLDKIVGGATVTCEDSPGRREDWS